MGKLRSMVLLEQLADRAPHTETAGRALLWLGDLSLQAGEPDRAERFYRRADRGLGLMHWLALRGQGDVALARGQGRLAARIYREAQLGGEPSLASELSAKVKLADRVWHERAGAWLCALMLAAAFATFVWRIGRGSAGPLGIPAELWYVVPVYALFIVGCLGRDWQVLEALSSCAAGLFGLILASGLAAMRAPPRRAWLQVTALVVSNFALFFLVLYQAGLIDRFLMTVHPT